MVCSCVHRFLANAIHRDNWACNSGQGFIVCPPSVKITSLRRNAGKNRLCFCLAGLYAAAQQMAEAKPRVAGTVALLFVQFIHFAYLTVVYRSNFAVFIHVYV